MTTSTIDLEDLGLESGGLALLRASVATAAPHTRVAIHGHADALTVHLAAWARAEGHAFEATSTSAASNAASPFVGWLTIGEAATARWRFAERAGSPSPNGIVAHPKATWGLAARGALVEAGAPAFSFSLDEQDTVWSDNAGAIYRTAAASQWDPETAIPWDAPRTHPDFVEDALVQVLTYLIENETAALVVPARFCAQVHPQFREVMQLLAIQAADEARHMEAFTRRALLARQSLGSSTIGGQTSLQTLVEEPDFAMASFLLSVLGEGSFLSLLAFLQAHAPDACTREIMRLVAIDEARHVAFGMSHLQRHAQRDATLSSRLRAAIERRHAMLRHTAGLNAEVFDALVLLAAGSLQPRAMRRGYEAVADLQSQMDDGRKMRLRKLGFADDEAQQLSALHTRNFM